MSAVPGVVEGGAATGGEDGACATGGWAGPLPFVPANDEGLGPFPGGRDAGPGAVVIGAPVDAAVVVCATGALPGFASAAAGVPVSADEGVTCADPGGVVDDDDDDRTA